MINKYFKLFLIFGLFSFVLSSCSSDDDDKKSDKNDLKIDGYYIGTSTTKGSVEVKKVSDYNWVVHLKPLSGKFETSAHEKDAKQVRLNFSYSQDATVTYKDGNNVKAFSDQTTIDASVGKSYEITVKSQSGKVQTYDVKFDYFLFAKDYSGTYKPVDLKKVPLQIDTDDYTVDLSNSLTADVKLSVVSYVDKSINMNFNFKLSINADKHKYKGNFSYDSKLVVVKDGEGTKTKWAVSDLALTSDKLVVPFDVTAGTGIGAGKTVSDLINDSIPYFVKALVVKRNSQAKLLFEEVKAGVWEVKKSAEAIVNGWNNKKIAYKLYFAKSEASKKSPAGAPGTNKYQAYTYYDATAKKYKIKAKVLMHVKDITFGDLANLGFANGVKAYLTIDGAK